PHRSAGAGIEGQPLRLAVEVAGGAGEVLSLPLVHVQLHGVAVRPLKRGVDIENRLDEVLARRKVGEGVERVSLGLLVDDGALARRESRDVLSEEGDRAVLAAGLSELEPRLLLRVTGDHDEDAAVDGLLADRGGIRDLEAEGFGSQGSRIK